jgi:hypothetical protein
VSVTQLPAALRSLQQHSHEQGPGRLLWVHAVCSACSGLVAALSCLSSSRAELGAALLPAASRLAALVLCTCSNTQYVTDTFSGTGGHHCMCACGCSRWACLLSCSYKQHNSVAFLQTIVAQLVQGAHPFWPPQGTLAGPHACKYDVQTILSINSWQCTEPHAPAGVPAAT